MGSGNVVLSRRKFYLLILVSVVVGCGSPEEGDVVEPEIPVEHPFIFDVDHVNFTGGFQFTGTYVDSKGNVVAYDHSFAPWHVENPKFATVAEINDKFHVPTASLGTVDPATLGEMFGMVEGARGGEIVTGGPTDDGPGTYTYGCHVYDEEVGGYVRVLLKRLGDYSATNTSEEAEKLVVWLDSLIQQADGGK